MELCVPEEEYVTYFGYTQLLLVGSSRPNNHIQLTVMFES